MAPESREQLDVGVQQTLKLLDANKADAKWLKEEIVDACDRAIARHADALVAHYIDNTKAPVPQDSHPVEMHRLRRMKDAIEKWRPSADPAARPVGTTFDEGFKEREDRLRRR